MVARRFLISLQQVIRSVLIILFPLAFITLFAWATAGSTYGSTADPMRAAVWLWLGAHLAPFNITSNEVSGYLSYLPLGAAILPWLSIRVGYRRVLDEIKNKKVSRTYFVLTYTIVYSLLAFIASNSQVSIDWARGLVVLLALLFLATTSTNFQSLVALPGYMFLIILGVSGLLFSISLMLNFSIAKNLTIVLHPGIIGGILLLILQILYLPNLFIASFSYISGAGFSLGDATDITPFVFNLREIPAIPALAALPAGEYPWVVIFSIMLLVYSYINLNKINKLQIDHKSKQQFVLRFLLLSVLGAALLAFASSGSLISANMNPVGVNPLRIGAIVFTHITITYLLMLLLPKLFKRKTNQSRLEP
jgi:hypothetical protein